MRFISFLPLLGLIALTSCDDPYKHTMVPDYTIKMQPTSQGLVAIPPACPSWTTETTDPLDNQPLPQFGCANARNLALMVDQPNDLLHGQNLGASNGVMAVGAQRRYYNNQTRGLLDPGIDATAAAITTSASSASTMSGEVTSSAAAGSSSSTSSTAP